MESFNGDIFFTVENWYYFDNFFFSVELLESVDVNYNICFLYGTNQYFFYIDSCHSVSGLDYFISFILSYLFPWLNLSFFLVIFIFLFIYIYIFRFIYICWRVIFNMFKYIYYIFYYIVYSFNEKELYDWGESFFFNRPDPEDVEENNLHHGIFDRDIGVENDVDVNHDPDVETAYDEDKGAFGGHFLFFLKNSMRSFFLLKHINYEFYFIFLEYFFTYICRFFFSFVCFGYFFIRSCFILLLKLDVFYIIFFIYFFFYIILKDIFFFLWCKLYFLIKRNYGYWLQFFSMLPGELFFSESDDYLEELFWLPKTGYKDLPVIDFVKIHELVMDEINEEYGAPDDPEYDVIPDLHDPLVDFYDNSNWFFFESFYYSPFFDILSLKAVKRLYRLEPWLFWSPVDLLDKRYYIPTFDDVFFVSKQLCFDIFMQTDSIFYKKVLLKKKDYSLNKNNMFFYDDKYDQVNLNFLNYQLAPNGGLFDLSVPKGIKFPSKAKCMSFKILLENDLLAFEKFYLSHRIFNFDNFDYSSNFCNSRKDLFFTFRNRKKKFISNLINNDLNRMNFMYSLKKEFKAKVVSGSAENFGRVPTEYYSTEYLNIQNKEASVKVYKSRLAKFKKYFKKYAAFHPEALKAQPQVATYVAFKEIDDLFKKEVDKVKDKNWDLKYLEKINWNSFIKAFPSFKYKGNFANPSFFFDNEFSFNENINKNFHYHSLFSGFKDFYSWMEDKATPLWFYPTHIEDLEPSKLFFFSKFTKTLNFEDHFYNNKRFSFISFFFFVIFFFFFKFFNFFFFFFFFLNLFFFFFLGCKFFY